MDGGGVGEAGGGGGASSGEADRGGLSCRAFLGVGSPSVSSLSEMGARKRILLPSASFSSGGRFCARRTCSAAHQAGGVTPPVNCPGSSVRGCVSCIPLRNHSRSTQVAAGLGRRLASVNEHVRLCVVQRAQAAPCARLMRQFWSASLHWTQRTGWGQGTVSSIQQETERTYRECPPIVDALLDHVEVRMDGSLGGREERGVDGRFAGARCRRTPSALARGGRRAVYLLALACGARPPLFARWLWLLRGRSRCARG